MATDRSDDLFPNVRNAADMYAINERCILRVQDGHCVVIVSGVILAYYRVGDAMAEAHAMVSLVNQGLADQNDVARAFHCSARSVRRHQRRYEEGGLAALGRKSGYSEGRRRLQSNRIALVQRKRP